MGFKEFFKGESKGFECTTQPDGSELCKRVVRSKDGKMDFDGQEMTIFADPDDNCKPVKVGNMRVMDDEWDEFDKIGKRVTSGCKRQINRKGITKG